MEPGSGNIAEEQIVKEVMEKGYVRSVAMPYAERSTEREQGLKREGTVGESEHVWPTRRIRRDSFVTKRRRGS